MSWTIEWVFALLLTSLSGSILYAFWYLAGKGLEKLGYINIVFEFLKVVMIFFFLPLGYLVLKVRQQEIGRGYLFTITPLLLTMSKIILGLWLCGAIFMWVRFIKNIKSNKQLMKNVLPCENKVVKQFEEIYRTMDGRKGQLEVCQSYSCRVPCVAGLFRRKLILPVKSYSSEELEIIFTHEITHHLQEDIVLKWICSFMLCLHYFNPFAWKFNSAIQKWSEFSCDYKACRVINSQKKYFTVITDIAVESSMRTCLSSQLTESANELIERIEKMKKNSKVKYRSKWMATLLSMIAFVTSNITVGAATVGSAKMYVDLYHSTEVEIEEVIDESQMPEYVEYIEYGNAEGVVEREGETNSLTRSWNGFEWAVAGNELVMTNGFSCTSGQGITIAAYMEPEDVEVKVGILQPDGSKRYVMGAGGVNYEFGVTTSGVYRVFVENNSGVLVQVDGTYGVN